MMQETRRFNLRSADGWEFVVVEYAALRWQPRCHQGRHLVERGPRTLYILGGHAVVPTRVAGRYLLTALGVEAEEFGESLPASPSRSDSRCLRLGPSY